MEAAEDRVRELCPGATIVRRMQDWFGGEHEYVVYDRFGDRICASENPAAAWEEAERAIRNSRYFINDQGGGCRTDHDQPTPEAPFRAVNPREYYTHPR